jgi:hypothetical protein
LHRDDTISLEVQERRENLLEQLPPPPEAALSAGEADAAR